MDDTWNGVKFWAFSDVGQPSRLPSCTQNSRRDACSTFGSLQCYSGLRAIEIRISNFSFLISNLRLLL